MNQWDYTAKTLTGGASMSAVSTQALFASGNGVAGDIFMVAVVTTGTTISSISQGAGAQDAWVKLGAAAGTGVNVELWATRMTGSSTSMGTITFSGSTTGRYEQLVFHFPSAATALPTATIAVVTASGSSTAAGGAAASVASGNLNDVTLFEVIGWLNATAPTAYTDAPTSPGDRFGNLLSTAGSATRLDINMDALDSGSATGSHSRTATITSANWSAFIVGLSTPAGSTASSKTGMVYKGRDTATLDQANAA